jgi:hypothetical protein
MASDRADRILKALDDEAECVRLLIGSPPMQVAARTPVA